MDLEFPLKTDEFEVTIDQKVAHLVLNNPAKANCMTPAFWRDLPRIVDALSDGGAVRALVISSTGKHFTAGMDLSQFQADKEIAEVKGRANFGEAFRLQVKILQDTFSALERARMPVIAAIQGGCIGGGVDLVTACDIRYASKDAFFCIHETNLGMTADVGTFPRLAKLIPEGVVRELAFTGRRLSAAEAFECRLVNRLAEDHEGAVTLALEAAREISAKAPLAVTGAKVVLNYGRDHTTADTLDYIAVWQTGMFKPELIYETAAAAKEGREPDYPDLFPRPKDGLGGL